MTKAELLQTAKPILFNTEMTRAILDGRKIQTRRIIKKLPDNACQISQVDENIWEANYGISGNGCCMDMYTEIRPPYKPGDILYVRETWMNPCDDLCRTPDQCDGCIYGKGYRYKADYRIDADVERWHPSIHMQKEAARIFLRVTDVRVERLRDITTAQIEAEGVEAEYPHVLNGREKIYAFSVLWNSTIKKTDLDRYGWDANPWVWVIEFERVEVTE